MGVIPLIPLRPAVPLPHSPSPSSPVQVRPGEFTEVEGFECEWPGCRRMFARRSNMNRHLAVHDANKEKVALLFRDCQVRPHCVAVRPCQVRPLVLLYAPAHGELE